MAETALDRVQRILQILPLAAAREDGIGYDELADTVGITRDRLLRDLTEIQDRDLYHSGDTGADIQIMLDADRVRVWTTGQLRRPPRLTPAEAAALDMGLRILAAERDDPDLLDRMRALLDRLAWSVPDDVADRVIAHGDAASADAFRALFVDAARRRRPVRFRYLKPDADGPERRALEPYLVAYAGGLWYAIGRDPDADHAGADHAGDGDGVRVFRVDRVLDAHLDDDAGPFDPPADFDPAHYLADGRVYRADADGEVEVTVRYGAPVARWVLERGEGELREDGSVVAVHRVADPGWVVRHVLQYGPAARVEVPDWVAALVRDAVGRVGRADREPPAGRRAPAGGAG